MYGTPAPSAERQHPEAWPATTYGHLRGVSPKIVPANNLFELFNKFSFTFGVYKFKTFQDLKYDRMFHT